jgi:hypothetical protein
MNTRTDESEASLSAPESISFSEQATLTPSLFGENSSTTADSKASIAPFSATKAAGGPQTLSDRLTPLLIALGLVKGITHTSIRKQSGAAIRDSALWPLDGGSAEPPKVD